MNVTFWFRGKSFEVIFVFQQATVNGAKSVCQGPALQLEVILPAPHKCWFVGSFHLANTISNSLCFRVKDLSKGLCLTTRGVLQSHTAPLDGHHYSDVEWKKSVKRAQRGTHLQESGHVRVTWKLSHLRTCCTTLTQICPHNWGTCLARVSTVDSE